jgi:hypothetical protein
VNSWFGAVSVVLCVSACSSDKGPAGDPPLGSSGERRGQRHDAGARCFQAARIDALLSARQLPITRALRGLACGGVSAGALYYSAGLAADSAGNSLHAFQLEERSRIAVSGRHVHVEKRSPEEDLAWRNALGEGDAQTALAVAAAPDGAA